MRDRRFALMSLAAFAACVTLMSVLHEPWRDETQTWRLAIDSPGIAALAYNARYEGTPLLFHVLLQLVGHLSRSWYAAVIVHLTIAVSAAWLILAYAPFTRVQKLLVIGGYYLVYEYAVIVRSYGLGMALGFGVCLAWTGKRQRPIVAGVLLALLANTSLLGLVVALAGALACALDWFLGKGDENRATTTDFALGAACVAAGFLVVLLTVTPASLVMAKRLTNLSNPVLVAQRGGPTIARWGLFHLAIIAVLPLKALTPIGAIHSGRVIWNSWVIPGPADRFVLGLEVLVTAALGLTGLMIASRRRVAVLFLVAATGGLLVFCALVGVVFMRHLGYFAVVWIMTAWLAQAGTEQRWPRFLQRYTIQTRGFTKWALTASLIPMVVAGGEFAVGEGRESFSDARNVATLLRTPPLAGVPLIAFSRAEGQTVAALLGRPIFMATTGRSSTFVVWGDIHETLELRQTAVDKAVGMTLQQACRVVVISAPPLEPSERLQAAAKLIYQTDDMPMSGERYQLWLIAAQPQRAAHTPPNDGALLGAMAGKRHGGVGRSSTARNGPLRNLGRHWTLRRQSGRRRNGLVG